MTLEQLNAWNVGSGFTNSSLNLGFNIYDRVENRRRYEELLQREDTAVQRLMSDVRNSGLNPQAFVGNSASSSTSQGVSGGSFGFDQVFAKVQAEEQIRAQQIANDNAEQEGINLAIAGEKAEEEIAYMKTQNEYLKGKVSMLGQDYQLNELTIQEKTSTIAKISHETDLLLKNIGKVEAEIGHISNQDLQILANIEKIYADIKHVSAETEYLSYQQRNSEIDLRLKELQEQFDMIRNPKILEMLDEQVQQSKFQTTSFRYGMLQDKLEYEYMHDHNSRMPGDANSTNKILGYLGLGLQVAGAVF